MVFSDLFFLFAFLPSFALFYLLASLVDRQGGQNNYKNLVIVIFSLIFYAWGEPIYVFLLLFCVLINYLSGLTIDRQKKHRKLALGVGISLNLSILAIFKYAGFFVESFNFILQYFDAFSGLQIPVPQVALPIGISFYTFQSISYLIDVYRGEAPVQNRFMNMLLYISMFPQLVAGPIVRYATIANQITTRRVSVEDLRYGLFRFISGLGKKVIIANQLSEVSDSLLVNGFNDLSTLGAWVGIIAFTLQIYYDFSGYSDMAIGMGRCLGFRFLENFNHPYCCTSITDFWRRWHISLGSFFRDYLYIPLGGNKRHQPLNILIVWFLTGMWHGASWNFIIWGLYFGLIVMLEKYTILKFINRVPTIFFRVYSLLLVIFGWGLFYFEDFTSMKIFFIKLFGGGGFFTDFIAKSALLDNFWLWLIAIIFAMPVRQAFANLCQNKLKPAHSDTILFLVRLVFSILIIVLSISLLVGATNNPFIYTKF